MTGYVLSRDAEADLINIWDWTVDTWSEQQADRYIRGIYRSFETIARNPRMGRIRSELREDIRSFAHQSHVIFYVATDEGVAVVRVLHGASDVEGVFRP